MTFIELHYDGKPRLIAVDKISALAYESENTLIWLTGDSDCLYVDESYDEIKNRFQEASFIWNV